MVVEVVWQIAEKGFDKSRMIVRLLLLFYEGFMSDAWCSNGNYKYTADVNSLASVF